MRLRLAVIATAVLIVCGTFVVAHRRAQAEHHRLALLQGEAVPAGTTDVAGEERAAIRAAPSLPGTPAETAPAAAPAGPIAAAAPAAPGGVVVQVTAGPPVAPGAVASGHPNAPGQIAPVQIAPVQIAPVQIAPPAPFYAPKPGGYFVPAPAGDPESSELTSQDQQLEQEVQSLARQLADSNDDKEQADLKDKLAGVLEKQFDVQQKLRQLEISRIEDRIQKLRDLVRKRTDSRRKIIENRLEQLLNDAEGLGWNSAKASGLQLGPHGLPTPSISPPAPDVPGRLPLAPPPPGGDRPAF